MKIQSLRQLGLHYFLFLSILLMSCSSADDGGNSGEFIIADVETLNFQSSNTPNAVTAAKIEGSSATTYIVQGFDDAANAIVLFVADYDGPGTYSLDFNEDTDGTSGIFSNLNGSWSSGAGQGGIGSITVSTDDSSETTGTFSFTAVQADNTSSSRVVSNGRFRAQY